MKLVLIVEDNEKNMKLARDVLQARGYATVEATTGEDGVKFALERKPDLVLMDINMPGMSGIDATCQIKASHPEVAVILLSPSSEADLPADALECGAVAYVHKEDFGPALVRQLWDGRASGTSGTSGASGT